VLFWPIFNKLEKSSRPKPEFLGLDKSEAPHSSVDIRNKSSAAIP